MATVRARCGSVPPEKIEMLARVLCEEKPAELERSVLQKLAYLVGLKRPPQEVTIPLSDGQKKEILLTHIVEFGYIVADALSRGTKIATGNLFTGYHSVGITLRGPMNEFTAAVVDDYLVVLSPADKQVELGLDEELVVSDVPTYRKLQRISQQMGLRRPEDAIDRLCYWFYVASQIAWLLCPIMMMDHKGETWQEFRYAPLWEVRNQLKY